MQNRAGIEENTLVILDSSEQKYDQHADDDRITFLEAVRSSCLVPEPPIRPTKRMFEAVFDILRGAKSIELIMTGYQLLNELNKFFPQASSSSSNGLPELVVAEEGWSPFVLDGTCGEIEAADKSSTGPLDFSGFYFLIEKLAEWDTKTDFQELDAKALGNMLLFQYLISSLEGDFLLRNNVYKETMNWVLLRESSLNIILGSRRTSYKGLMRDCVSVLCTLSQVQGGEDSIAKSPKDFDAVVATAILEVKKSTCVAMQKLLAMIMELDELKKTTDKGHSTRADGVRTPLVEIILDELTYNVDLLSPFLQAFNESKWKSELVLQYLTKYMAKPKPSVRTWRSNSSAADPVDDESFGAVLKSFSNNTNTKGIIKKIGVEVVQLLLAHGFQAHLSLSSQQPAESTSDSCQEGRGSSIIEICKNLISAFNSLRGGKGKMEILPVGKEALFMAAIVLSTKSSPWENLPNVQIEFDPRQVFLSKNDDVKPSSLLIQLPEMAL